MHAQAETFGVELSNATVREAIKLFLQHSRTGPLRKVSAVSSLTLCTHFGTRILLQYVHLTVLGAGQHGDS